MVRFALTHARKLALLTLAGLVLRVAFLLLEPPTQPVADERPWTAWGIETGGPKVRFSPLRSDLAFFPPGYPYFIGAVHAAFGGLEAVQVAQILVSVLLIPAVGRIATLAFSPGAGLIAAGITASYPDLVWYSVHFWSETLFLTLLFWAFERLLAADARRKAGPAVAAGVLWGLAVLTRETVLYLLPLAALWLLWGRRAAGGRARGAAFLLAALATVAPWTLRNWVKYEAFIPVSTAGGLNLWQGNAPLTRQEVYDRYYAVEGVVEQFRNARRQGLQAIRDRQPLWIFEKLASEMPRFWEADSLALIHIKRGAYRPVSPRGARRAWLLVIVPYLAVLALFVLGLAGLEWSRERALLLGFLVLYNLLHVATHGFARYRLPVMPVVFMLAAAAWLAWRSGRGPWRSPRRRLAAVGLGLVVLLLLVPGFRLNYQHPAFGFVREIPGMTAPGSEEGRQGR
jgi:4-amino-4-deoxy-L-arabinose transferase-like glycosyltransferase